MTLIEAMIGKPVSFVEPELDDLSVRHRRSKKDGQYYMLTRDYDPNRYNLTIENDIVTEITLG